MLATTPAGRGGDPNMRDLLKDVGLARSAVLLTVLLLAGCAGAPVAERAPTATTGPDETQVAATTSPVLKPVQPPGETGLNFTACEGFHFNIQFPAAWAREQLPPAYSLDSTSVAGVDVDMAACSKLAIEGLDVGAASLVVLSTYVLPPKGAPPGDHDENWYVLEVRTNSSALQKWLSRGPRVVGYAEVSHSFVPHPNPAWTGDSETEAKSNGTSWYHLRSHPEKAVHKVDNSWRWFYGPDPKTDFWEMHHVLNQSWGYGEGLLTAAPASPLATMGKGITEWAGTGADEYALYRFVRPYESAS